MEFVYILIIISIIIRIKRVTKHLVYIYTWVLTKHPANSLVLSCVLAIRFV